MKALTPLRMAMVGGGPGAFIGPVHRMAAELDGRIRLVAGSFSRDAARNAEAGRMWGIDQDRTYGDWRTMLAAEAARPDGARLVAVVTPNDTHFAGDLGAVRKIVVEYAQGWLSRPIERDGDRQAGWRNDPAQAGVGGCIADIGVHAFNIAEFVSGVRVERLCADVASVVPGRVLDDDCNMLLRFEGGVRGVLIASQISAGARNGLQIKVYGENGCVSWSHDRPVELALDLLDAPSQILHAASGYLSAPARARVRIPTGHPEGFIEAFANLYADMADAISAGRTDPTPVPGIADGLRGMAFVERAVAASRDGEGWVSLDGVGL